MGIGGIGIEPVRARPVRYDEPRFDEFPRRRCGMFGEPTPDFDAARVVFSGEVDVHRGSLALAGVGLLN